MLNNDQLRIELKKIKRLISAQSQYYLGLWKFLKNCTQEEYEQYSRDFKIDSSDVPGLSFNFTRTSQQQDLEVAKKNYEFYLYLICLTDITATEHLQMIYDRIYSIFCECTRRFELEHDQYKLALMPKIGKKGINDPSCTAALNYKFHNSLFIKDQYELMRGNASPIGVSLTLIFETINKGNQHDIHTVYNNLVQRSFESLRSVTNRFDKLAAEATQLCIDLSLIDQEHGNTDLMLAKKNRYNELYGLFLFGFKGDQNAFYAALHEAKVLTEHIKAYNRTLNAALEAHKNKITAVNASAKPHITTPNIAATAVLGDSDAVKQTLIIATAEQERAAQQKGQQIAEEIRIANARAAAQAELDAAAARERFATSQRTNANELVIAAPAVAPKKYVLDKDAYEILEQIFANSHNLLGVAELIKVAEAFDAKVIRGRGSSIKFEFEAFDFFTLEPRNTTVMQPLHLPHGQQQGRGKFYGVYIKQFKQSLIEAGITLENCTIKNDLAVTNPPPESRLSF